MKIEEEIRILQFAQGILSEADVLDPFSKLSEGDKFGRIHGFQFLLERVKPTEAEIERFNPSSNAPTDSRLIMFPRWTKKRGIRLKMADDEQDNSYRMLLNLFKTAYQRMYATEKDNPENMDNWWYRELSDPETVAGILARYQAMVDELYRDSGFRTEFVTMARLWHDNHASRKAEMEEPMPEEQTHAGFVTYEQMSTGFLEENKKNWAFPLVHNSVARALGVRFKLNQEQAGRLLNDVLERHLRETYNTGFRD